MGLDVEASEDWATKLNSPSLRKRNSCIENLPLDHYPGMIKPVAITEDFTNHDFRINPMLFEQDA
ncbi:hypothetical protein PFLuk1_00706 [Pseudomonas fluorescens]|nr:hypothetical protein PFLuk1_00706 [Pseudomonas fluorescens]